MLQEEIEHMKLKGITQEEFDEIDENWNTFDKNKDGVIDKRELKACLYSLGEEKSRADIEAIIKEYGDGKVHIQKERFRDFMIHLLGDTDTKDEIIQSFTLINRGDEQTTDERLEVMEDRHANYVKEKAAPLGDGYDTVALTEDMYSR